MTKSELITILSDKFSQLVHKDAELSVKTIIDSLGKNNRVELRGFGTFGVKHRKPKKARNPGTGEAIYLPERHVPTFKPAKNMRSHVNEKLTK